jgi:alpha-galactosidase
MRVVGKNMFRRFLDWRGFGLIFLFAAQIAFSQTTRPDGQSFTSGELTRKPRSISIMQGGRWRVEYDLAHGVADIFCDGKILLPRVFAVVKLPEAVTSRDYQTRKISRRKINDGFGRGEEFAVESANGDADKMIQTFWLYEKLDYILAEVKILRKPGASSNFMSPLTTETPVSFRADGDNRALFVPFDNDKWIRYNAVPFGTNVTSYEVSALYNNASRQGLVIGSIEHDVWKTGVKSTTSSDAITSLQIFGGITSGETRDVLPRVWKGGVPFGWNSWGKLQGKISFTKAVQASDFFAQELPQFQNDGVAYIGLDSGWNKFSDAELKQFVDHCQANHQEAGIYFTPFAAFGRRSDDANDAGTDYKYKDIYLYANGRKQSLDGGTALDPTHPGTKRLIELALNRFKQVGFKYIKADFLGHGALEGSHFDPQVTTGIQAYNAGMKFISDTAGRDIYLNESIAPLFPAQYANSRRIACDTFGEIGQIEYMLNALTFGWWLAGVYDFNDADHVVLDGFTEGENRARTTSSVITGIFISGDDFSTDGSITGKERAKRFLTNAEVNDVARIKKSFRPVEGDSANRAANLFSYEDKNYFYLAAFNFASTGTVFNVELNRVGLAARRPVEMKELWSSQTNWVSNSVVFQLPPADAALYKFYKCGSRMGN